MQALAKKLKSFISESEPEKDCDMGLGRNFLNWYMKKGEI